MSHEKDPDQASKAKGGYTKRWRDGIAARGSDSLNPTKAISGRDATLSAVSRRQRGRSRPSVSDVIKDTLARATTASHRHFIPIAPTALSRIEHQKEIGSEVLCAAFPAKEAAGDIHTIDLSFLLELPEIADALADAFLVIGQTNAITSRDDYRKSLRKFASFLSDSGYQHIKLCDFTRPLWTGFIRYLDGQELKQTTRAVQYIHIKRFFAVLAKHPKWKAIAAPILPEIVQDPWPGYKRRNTPTPPIPEDEYEAIMRAAEVEVFTLFGDFARIEACLNTGRERNVVNPAGWKIDAEQLMAHIVDSQNPELLTKDAWERAGVSATLRKRFKEIVESTFPTQRVLTPFLLLLADATAYNPDGVRSLCKNHIKRRTSESQKKIITISGIKRRGERAANPQPLSFDGEHYPDQLGIAGIIDALESISDRVRPFVKFKEHADRLFLFRDHLNNIQSFVIENETNASSTSTHPLRAFAADHGLPEFTLQQFRTTVLNREMQRTGDLRSGQRLGLQKSITIVQNHYTSGTTRKKFHEQVGDVLHLRNRFLSTKGKIDPRKVSLKQDKACATPGFDCLDPFDSRRLGQRSGRLCDAYGECPGCPLVIPNPNIVENVALWLALRNAICLSQRLISPESWIAKWAEILSELEALLCHVPKEVLKNALHIPVTLPPVG